MMTTAQQIKHLSWRAGFGLSPSEWEKAKQLSRSDYMDQLFLGVSVNLDMPNVPVLPKDVSEESRVAIRLMQKQSLHEQKAAWIERMSDTNENAFLERMSLFWHGHFACVTKITELAVTQLNTIRQYALGNFRDLLNAIARDPSMIRFLNNQQNRKASPNENFARELLELFTIGRGNYTEQDIKEAARAFTGWSGNKKGKFIFIRKFHDEGQKTFFGKTGNFNGTDIIDLILERKETAIFITRKIYRYFVNPKVKEERVHELAKSFYESNYDIGKLMRSIFDSDWFYAPENVGVKIKSPVDLIAGTMRTLEINFSNHFPLLRLQRLLGQELFTPPNVAGWKGDQNWIDHATLMMRLNLTNHLVALANKDAGNDEGEAMDQMMSEMQRQNFSKKGKAYLQFEPIVQNLESKSSKEIFEELSDYLLQQPNNLEQSDVEKFVLTETRSQYIQSLMLRLMSLPEYQLC